MRLNELRDNPGATHRSKRIGRGIGSGKGKTAGKGHKGQKARSGVAVAGFEGGQMPIYRRLPKRGFKNPMRRTYQELNLSTLQRAIDEGRVDPAQPIDAEVLRAAGIVRRVRDGIRLLGKGSLTSKVTLQIAGGTRSALAAVAAAGGSVVVGGQQTEPTERAEG